MSKISWTNEKRKISDLIPAEYNPRQLTEKQAKDLDASLERFNLCDPIIINADNKIIGGHQRINILKQRGAVEVDVRVPSRQLTEHEEKELNLRLNKNLGEWDFDLLADFDQEMLLDVGFDSAELDKMFQLEPDAKDDEVPEVPKEPISKTGDIWILGRHRVMCGDSTKIDDVEKLMDGKKADMVFTDPPYGIGKDIVNDNLKREDWLNFYRDFTTNVLLFLKTNGYFYVWGYFDFLSNYWESIIKGRGDCNFRNFIIWVKNFVQGRNSLEFRQFPEQYGACLLCIYGQPFQNGPLSTSPNAEFFPECFEPLRAYLDGERMKMGWDIPTVKKIVGHSDLSRDHWFSKSQWSMPTEKVYKALQEAARNDAFRKEYDAFRKEYDELRKEYDELRKEYDELRGYHDNSHSWTDVWQFEKLSLYGDHPTKKPVEVCERGVITNAPKDGLVLDMFLGSGSTLIACEKTNRICYGMEIDPKYVDVIVKRWEDFTGKKAELCGS